MFEIVSGFEREYYPILASVLNDIDQRRKTPWLEQDLITLGASAPPSSAPVNVLSLPLYHILGKLYVLEGSTLGGAVIYRQLQPILQFSPEKGGRYFYGYGAQTGKMWKLFMEVLTTIAIEKEGEQEILQGANAQFAAMKAYFDQKISIPNDYQQYR
jgi:heme oxygenase